MKKKDAGANLIAALITIITFLTAVFGVVCGFFFVLAFRRKEPKLADKVFGGPKQDPDNDYRKKLMEKNNAWLASRKTADFNMPSEDGLELHATMIWAESDHHKTVIMIHGFRASGTNDFPWLMRYYHNQGFNVLLVDDRAHGLSEGNWLGFSWLDRRDLVGWARLIVSLLGEEEKILLHGLSMGGAAVMMASGEADLPVQVKAIVEDCGFSTTLDQFRHVFPDKLAILREPVLAVDSFICKLFRGYYFSEASSLKQLEKDTRPMLFIHGGSDTFVPTQMVYENYYACSGPKEIYICEDAEHAMSYFHDSAAYEKKVSEFLSTYFD